jgi:hypothetical protein
MQTKLWIIIWKWILYKYVLFEIVKNMKKISVAYINKSILKTFSESLPLTRVTIAYFFKNFHER